MVASARSTKKLKKVRGRIVAAELGLGATIIPKQYESLRLNVSLRFEAGVDEEIDLEACNDFVQDEFNRRMVEVAERAVGATRETCQAELSQAHRRRVQRVCEFLQKQGRGDLAQQYHDEQLNKYCD